MVKRLHCLVVDPDRGLLKEIEKNGVSVPCGKCGLTVILARVPKGENFPPDYPRFTTNEMDWKHDPDNCQRAPRPEGKTLKFSTGGKH